MASSLPPKIIEQDLICQVCYEVLEKNPYTLRCLHNYCGECVEKIERSEKDGNPGIFCPVCKKFSADDDIQYNHLLQRVIEGFAHLLNDRMLNRPTVGKRCRQCKNVQVIAYCVNCDCPLCEICQYTHLEFKEFRNHNVVAIGDMKNPPVINVVKMCPLHPGSPIKAHCKPCKKAICPECVLGKHNSHQTEDIQTAFSKLLPQVKTKLQKIHSKCEEVKQMRNTVESINDQTLDNLREVYMQAQAEMKQKMEQLEKDFEKLSDIIFSQRGVKQGEMIKQDLDHTVSCMETLYSWVNTLTELTQGPGVLFEIQNELMGRINAYANEDLDLRDAEEYICKGYRPATFIPTEAPNLVGDINFGIKDQNSSQWNKSTIQMEQLETKLEQDETAITLSSNNTSNLLTNSHFLKESSKMSAYMPQIKEDGFDTSEGMTKSKSVQKKSTFVSRRRATMPEIEVSGEMIGTKEIPEKSSRRKSHSATSTSNSKRRSEKERLAVIKSHRNTDFDLKSFLRRPPKKQKTVKPKQKTDRICCFKNRIFCACWKDNCIDVYDKDLEFIKTMRLIFIRTPHALHPLNKDTLLVAAANGLFTIDSSGENESSILKGIFRDVHAYGDCIAILKKGQSKTPDSVNILAANAPFTCNISSEFILQCCDALSVLLYDDQVFVSAGYQNHNISIYSLDGDRLVQFGKEGFTNPGHFHDPYLCVSDDNGTLLVGDSWNHRLQVGRERNWSIVEGVKVKYPKDCIIVDKRMYVKGDKEICLFQL